MKKFIFIISISFIFLNCNFNKPKSGIVLWENSSDLTYEKTMQYDLNSIKHDYPKSEFIDFENVDRYSKSNHTFTVNKNKVDIEAGNDLQHLSHYNENQFFSIYIEGRHCLTGISYMNYLSAQIPKFPYDNPILLILAKNGDFKLSNTIYDIDGDLGLQESDLSDYDFSEIENYFNSRKKMVN
mgnify:CR=1 FL=1